MCVVCGCGNPDAPAAEGGPKVNPATGDLHFGAGAAGVSVPGMSAGRALRIEEDVLGENNRIAAANRTHFAAHGVTALNLVSSPGSGKTTLLVATIEALRRRRPDVRLAVIEGDQQTSHDADRIRATGAPAIQVNTGKGCHLDAPMVAAAFARLPLHAAGHGDDGVRGHAHTHDHGHGHGHEHGHEQERDHAHVHVHSPAAGHDHAHVHDDAHAHAHGPGAGDGPAAPALLFIENVGNLVCPAMWDLGEAAKVTILSVTEGEDKPLKYPDMFAASRLMVLNKVDLLPYLDFDVNKAIEAARRVNPAIAVLQVSATKGIGMEAWLDWIRAGARAAAEHRAELAKLKSKRLAMLEEHIASLR